MSIYQAKAAIRQAKNLTKGYSDIQVKVREATSNDPWGPSGSQMAELADASFSPALFLEIMDMVDKRLNDSGKNWRHVFKALTLLDYLIHSGSEQVIAYAKQNLYVIKTLKEFQFIDEEGKDQGMNVRERSKAIASLLSDDERLKEARKTRQSLKDKIGTGPRGAGSSSGAGGHDRTFGAPASSYEEEAALERAIEESKRTALEEERRVRNRDKEEANLQHAIRVSQNDLSAQSASPPVQQQSQVSYAATKEVDLWGANVTSSSGKGGDFDFFSSMANPAPVVQTSPDPFGLIGNTTSFQSNQSSSFQQQSFGMQQQQQPFGQQQHQQPFGQQQPFGGQSQGFGQQPFGQQSQPFPQQQQPFGAQSQSFGGQQPFGQQQQGSLAAQGKMGSGNLFDTGLPQKAYIATSGPNAQIAAIARNSSQIDPFASMATSNQNSSPFGNGGNAFAASTPSFGHQQQPLQIGYGGNQGGGMYQQQQASQSAFMPQQGQGQIMNSAFAPNPYSGASLMFNSSAPQYTNVSVNPQGFNQQAQPPKNDPFASLSPFASGGGQSQQPRKF